MQTHGACRRGGSVTPSNGAGHAEPQGGGDGGNVVPVLSRRIVSATMAARGMRSAAELAAGKPCGTRVRYYAGCRCAECRRANTAYETERAAARRRGEGNGLVSAERARVHLVWLSSRGVGHKTAADAAKVANSLVTKIVYGQRTKIRAQSERRILAVTEAAAADRALIGAGPTWLLIDELIAWGYSQTRIASELLGRRVLGLQVGRQRVTVRTAERVRRLHERLRCVPAQPTMALLRELSDEGFNRQRVARLLAEQATQRGWDAPDTAPRGGLIRQQTAELVHELHGMLIEPEEDFDDEAVAHG